jgi:hypothetical protein
MPTIDLPDDELAAVVAAIRRAIEGDVYPHAPRLDVLKAALARLDAAAAPKPTPQPKARVSNETKTVSNGTPQPDPKAPPPAKADKRARR